MAASRRDRRLLGGAVRLYGTPNDMYASVGRADFEVSRECIAPSRWKLSMILYIISFVSYGATLVFYAAAFPRLARNTPYCRKLRDSYKNGEISAEEYEREESLEKNRISNVSTVSCVQP